MPNKRSFIESFLCFTEEYKYFIRDGLIFPSESKTGNSLTLGEADDFQPTTDPSMRDHMRDACIHSQVSYIRAKYELLNRVNVNFKKYDDVYKFTKKKRWKNVVAIFFLNMCCISPSRSFL